MATRFFTPLRCVQNDMWIGGRGQPRGLPCGDELQEMERAVVFMSVRVQGGVGPRVREETEGVVIRRGRRSWVRRRAVREPPLRGSVAAQIEGVGSCQVARFFGSAALRMT